jgi:type IV pilus assembly protein PilM
VSDSFWKKEISFGRKPKKNEQPSEGEIAPAIKAILEPEQQPVEPAEVVLAEVAQPPAEQPVADVEAPADDVVAPTLMPIPMPSEQAAAPTELPPSKGDYGWLTTSFDPNDLPDEMPAIAAPPVSGPPPVRVPLAESIGSPEMDLESVVAPPVEVEVELEPEAGGQGPSTPFWKKEFSFGRGSKEPTRPKEPKQGKTKQPKESKAAKETKAKEPPFWKRELKFGRTPQETTESTAVKEQGAKKPPIWKRELKFGRTAQEATELTAVKEPKAKKPPIWKRELKFERKPKDANEPKGEKEPKAAKEPREKKKKTLKTGIVGLKIGASQVAAARVTNNGGSPQLQQVARASLPAGVVVGGELRDIETLAETLKEMFAKHKLPKKGIRLGIANNRIGVRTFEIAGIDDPKQLANAIKFRAQETLPIPLEEAVLDWQLLDESTDEETGQTVRRVLLVVAYRELVERYVLACKKAGISVAGIDLEAFAMLRALAEPPAPDAAPATGAQVVVNVGHDRSTFAVSDGRVCEFTRVLGWGGQNLSVAIARALDITPSEATPLKHALSLVAQSTPPEGISPEALGAAREAVTRELQSFARELVSSLRFYQNQPGSLGIGQLVLTGGSAHLPGFADELHRLIGVPVTVGDPLNRVAIPKKFREPEYALGSLTVAIGLGIED